MHMCRPLCHLQSGQLAPRQADGTGRTAGKHHWPPGDPRLATARTRRRATDLGRYFQSPPPAGLSAYHLARGGAYKFRELVPRAPSAQSEVTRASIPYALPHRTARLICQLYGELAAPATPIRSSDPCVYREALRLKPPQGFPVDTRIA